MTIDLMSGWPGWATNFEISRVQARSGSRGGKAYVLEFGAPLWRATFSTRELKPNELDYWKAMVNRLNGGMEPFYAWPSSRCYPIAYPNGSWPGGLAFDGVAKVEAVNANGAISFKDLPNGFVISVGDYFSVRNTLYQVLTPATANSFGTTLPVQVAPYLLSTIAADDDASFLRPRCIMGMIPDTLSMPADIRTGRGTITFEAMEVRP